MGSELVLEVSVDPPVQHSRRMQGAVEAALGHGGLEHLGWIVASQLSNAQHPLQRPVRLVSGQRAAVLR